MHFLIFVDVIAITCPDGTTRKVAGEDVLVFVSGCDREPPLGFPKTGHLVFNHDPRADYATSSTCDLNLILPIKEDYPDFRMMMLNSLLLYGGFGTA